MKKLLCLMMVAVMAIGLVACGGLKTSDLEGDYEFVKWKNGKDTITMKDLKKLSSDAAFTLKIKEDGKGELNMTGEKQDVKFDVDKKTVKTSGGEATFTYEDDTLTMNNKKEKSYIVFKKK